MPTAIVCDAASMGRIVATFTVTNRADQVRAEAGVLPADEVRSVTVEDVLVDTGATTLCLPADLIARLGLAPLREVVIATATGTSRTHIYQDAKIMLLGRETTTECIELPAGRPPLLGVIPLEALGLELDLKSQRLRVLPDETNDTYLTVM